MKMPTLLFAALFFLPVSACPVQAADLTVYTEEFPPFNFSKGDQIRGVSTEVVTHVLTAAGMTASIKSLPWAEAYGLAQKQKNVLIYSISRRAEREKLFKWIGVITPTTYSVIALASRKDIIIKQLPDMKRYKIGTTIDDVMELWLLGRGFGLTDFVRTAGENSTLKLYKNLLDKRIDVWPAPDAVAYHVVRQEGHSSPEAVIQKIFPLDELSDGFYLAASLGTSDEVVARLSRGLKKFKETDKFDKIMNHWGIDSGLKSMLPIAKLIHSVKSISRISSVGYLSSDRVESHREGGYYRKAMREDFVESYVGSFDKWREKYIAMQDEVDMIILGSTEGISGWDGQKAIQLIMNDTRVPTGTMVTGLADYACIGFESEEMVVNLKVASKAGLRIPKSLRQKAFKVIE